jgi:hypothetical protein
MPNATLADIALRSTNPVKRAMDVFWIVMLELLVLMVVAREQDPDKRHDYPDVGAHSILARLGAGDTFDLPLLLVARSGASSAACARGSFGAAWVPSDPTLRSSPHPENAAARAHHPGPPPSARRRPPGARCRARLARRTMPPARPPQSTGFRSNQPFAQRLSRSESFRYRDVYLAGSIELPAQVRAHARPFGSDDAINTGVTQRSILHPMVAAQNPVQLRA